MDKKERNTARQGPDEGVQQEGRQDRNTVEEVRQQCGSKPCKKILNFGQREEKKWGLMRISLCVTWLNCVPIRPRDMASGGGAAGYVCG